MGTGVGAGAATGAAVIPELRMSAAVTRPRGPVPVTLESSTFNSLATRLAAGEARTILVETKLEVSTTGLETATCGAATDMAETFVLEITTPERLIAREPVTEAAVLGFLGGASGCW